MTLKQAHYQGKRDRGECFDCKADAIEGQTRCKDCSQRQRVRQARHTLPKRLGTLALDREAWDERAKSLILEAVATDPKRYTYRHLAQLLRVDQR